jgi:uncharacterized membrane protein YhaH (DUF805 family)
MPIRQILFGFNGRITRKQWWWITFLFTLVLVLLAAMIVFPVTWVGMSGGQISGRISSDSVHGGISSDLPRMAEALLVTSIIVTLIFLWSSLAVCAKRLHDLNISGSVAVIPYLLWGADLAASYTGLLGPTIQPNAALLALQMAESLVGIGLLLVLGFIRGTQGSNRYGSDPLARS